jgi:alkylated DNA repair dioxygenase AlkB
VHNIVTNTSACNSANLSLAHVSREKCQIFLAPRQISSWTTKQLIIELIFKMSATKQVKRSREDDNNKVDERPLKKLKSESGENEEKKEVDPFTTINLQAGGVFRYDDDFLSKEEAQELFDKLYNELTWQQSDIKMYGKVLKSPRMQCWMSENSVDADVYLKTKATPWREDIIEIKTRLEKLLNCKFDYLLFNLYRNGNDYIGFHADREAIPKVFNTSFFFETLLNYLNEG